MPKGVWEPACWPALSGEKSSVLFEKLLSQAQLMDNENAWTLDMFDCHNSKSEDFNWFWLLWMPGMNYKNDLFFLNLCSKE